MLTRPFLVAGLSMFLGTLALGMATPGLTTWVAKLGGGPGGGVLGVRDYRVVYDTMDWTGGR